MTWVLYNLSNNKTKGSSEVWSDKLRLLNNKAHGVTEGRRIIKYKAVIGNRGAWSQGGAGNRNGTRSHGEDVDLLEQSNGSHGGTVGA